MCKRGDKIKLLSDEIRDNISMVDISHPSRGSGATDKGRIAD